MLARKQAALRHYFDDLSPGRSLDEEHVLLPGFEQPVLARDYVRPATFIDAVYGGRGMPVHTPE